MTDAAFAPIEPVLKPRSRAGRLAACLARLAEPGDKTLQTGGGFLGGVFLMRGAFHEILAPLAEIEAFQADCQAHGLRLDRLKAWTGGAPAEARAALDAALIGPAEAYPAMAAHVRHAAVRLKTGGSLILAEPDTGAAARLADALVADPGWRLDSLPAGAAIFRKTAAFEPAMTGAVMARMADPRRKPRGLRSDLASRLRRAVFGPHTRRAR